MLALSGFSWLPATQAYAQPNCEKRNQYGQCVLENEAPGNEDPGQDEPQREPQVGDTWDEEGLTSVCGNSGPPGTPGSDLECGASRACPNENEYNFRVWLRTHTYQGNGQWDIGPWRDQGSECRDLSTDEDSLITEDQVIREVERFGLRPATLNTNPPNGRTFVNLPTIFHADAGRYEFRLPELGPGVDIRATPARFSWRFGDGASTTTEHGGRPYDGTDPQDDPDHYLTHSYERRGEVTANVVVDYTVEWNAGSGWQTITETIPSPATTTDLTIAEGAPVLTR